MMRRHKMLAVVAGATTVWGTGLLAITGAASAWAAAAAHGTAVAAAAAPWGQAIEVPGLGVLDKGGNASARSVACGKSGVCAAGGDYQDQHKHLQGFVVLKRKGQWGKAIEVPGLGTLNKGDVDLASMACGPAGRCSGGGTYTDGSGHTQGFVTNENNGTWSRAIEVPGLAALNLGGKAKVSQMTCTPGGNCAAGGMYTDGDGHAQGFVASAQNGTWGQAIEVPGLGALNVGGSAGVSTVSCATEGNCTAGGDYADGVVTDEASNKQGFVAIEKNGHWGQATDVPGLDALNGGGDADVLTASCPANGTCAIGGFYFDGDQSEQGFVADEKNGAFGQAIEVPGLGPLNAGNDSPLAFVASIACATPANCTATGDYGWPYSWAFMASEKNGTWGKVTSVSISASLAVGRTADLGTMACVSPGNCVTGGSAENFTHKGNFDKAFVVIQKNGQWNAATTVPGLKGLSQQGTDVASVSCGGSHCTAAGAYTDHTGHNQAFVTK
jgi:hypothetical protein